MWCSRYARWGLVVGVLAVGFQACAVQAETKKGSGQSTVSAGKQVALEYTLKTEDKGVVESNVGKAPLLYTHGQQQLIPGLEKALEGMREGESKHVTVPPEQAYGPLNPSAVQEVKKDAIPKEAQKVGAQLQGRGKDGQVLYPRVVEVRQDTVMLDFNHPLAGKTLQFDVKVLEIKSGPESVGHDHGQTGQPEKPHTGHDETK